MEEQVREILNDSENSYRRGYHQGYAQSLRDLGYTEAAIDETIEKISEWRYRGVRLGEIPPSVNPKT